jgi:hypothetical protein
MSAWRRLLPAGALAALFGIVAATALTAGAAPSCRGFFVREKSDRVLDHQLSGEVMAALRAAAKNADYADRINGVDRSVVLFGEVHGKTPEAVRLADDVRKQFAVHGLEGADLSKTWGGWFFSRALDTLRAVYHVASLGRRAHASAIDDSDFETQVADVLRNKIYPALDAGTTTIEQLEGLALTMGGREINLAAAVRQYRGASSTAGHIRSIDLEEGHVPTIVENIYSVLVPTMLASLGVSASSLALDFIVPQNWYSAVTQRAPVETLSIGVAAIFSFDAIIAKLRATRFRDSKLLKQISLQERALGGGRNLTMAKNIELALAENPDMTTLLVIAGGSHVYGLKDLLTSRQGFAVAPSQP